MEDLLSRILLAKEKACKFLLSMQIEDGVFDTSPLNQNRIKQMSLPATYNAISALGLMNSLHLVNGDRSRDFILQHKKRNGFYRMVDIKRRELSYPSFEYTDLHITNYSISALGYLDYRFQKNELSFLRRYNSKRKLGKWLDKRNMSAPWNEGNYVVNLASFLILGKELYIIGCDELMTQMIQWHYDNQDEFGYYHDVTIDDLTNAFAGATHNYHIFYYYNLPIARYKQVIDYLLTRPTDIVSACIDVDEIDVLANFIKYNYRTDDIKEWLTRKLISLLDFQNEDGGFSDEISGNRVFDGWTKYIEPQGISNCFATWFRMLAIGMIAVTLFNDKDNFTFRKSIGIGYFNRDYLNSGYNEEELYKQERDILSRSAALKSIVNNSAENELDDNKVQDIIEMFQEMFSKIDKAKLNSEAIFSVTIIDEGRFNIVIKDKSITVSKGANQAANLFVSVKRKTLYKIMSGKLDAKLAYGLGKLKCKGNISYALKLSVLLK